jgi:hypothetical protein
MFMSRMPVGGFAALVAWLARLRCREAGRASLKEVEASTRPARPAVASIPVLDALESMLPRVKRGWC